MAHEKVWQYALNNQFADVSSVENQSDWFLWATKQFLIGQIGMTDESGAVINAPSALWDVAGSSDSVTAGMDGVDRWGTTFDPTKIVHNTTSAARSWMCLHNATLGVWVVFDCAAGSTSAPYQMVLSLCFVAPTGGSTTARPTSTDEVAVSGTPAFMDSSAGNPKKAHFWLATDGSFNALHSKDGSGLVTGGIVVHKVVLWSSGDSRPVVAWVDAATNGAFRSAAPITNTSSCILKDATGAARSSGVSSMTPYVGGQNFLTLTSGRAPDGNGLMMRFSFLIGDSSSGRVKGRLQDIFLACASALDTDLIPQSGTPTDQHIGALIFPISTPLTL